MKKLLIILLIPITANSANGYKNPDVTQSNIMQTICVKGWTKTIRPPVSYTNKFKKAQLNSKNNPKLYEEDHMLPLELGGHPTEPENILPQPWGGNCGAHVKDKEENLYKKKYVQVK